MELRPTVEEMQDGAMLYGWGGGAGLALTSPGWQSWLDAATTRRFRYAVFDAAKGYIASYMTVQKEQRQRGSGYWVAYQRVRGKLHKVYLGSSHAVTAERLRQIAAHFQGKEGKTPEKTGL